MEDKRYALLIDSDNISAKYISAILEELTKYGVVSYKRIYGDWTSPQNSKWRDKLLQNSLIPIQQFANTTGKNATDSAMIIDAMDILYTKNVDGFCIVSSDSDFTRLVSRLRESGMMVIGMGEKKTAPAFRQACNIFTMLENLLEDDDREEEPDKPQVAAGTVAEAAVKASDAQVISRKRIESTIVSIITENENIGKVTGLGEIGSRLVNQYPDFDVRNYGYSLLSKFLEETAEFELKKTGNTVMVSLKDNNESKERVITYIRQVVQCKGKEGVEIDELGRMVHTKFKKFNVKDYGYSQFLKFLQSIEGVEIRSVEGGRKRAVRKG